MTEAAKIIWQWKAKNDNASNAELARQAGVPTNTVRNILLGKGVTASTLVRLQRVRGLAGLQAYHFENGGAS